MQFVWCTGLGRLCWQNRTTHRINANDGLGMFENALLNLCATLQLLITPDM